MEPDEQAVAGGVWFVSCCRFVKPFLHQQHMFGHCPLHAGLCEKGCSQAVEPDKQALAGGVWCAAPNPRGKNIFDRNATNLQVDFSFSGKKNRMWRLLLEFFRGFVNFQPKKYKHCLQTLKNDYKLSNHIFFSNQEKNPSTQPVKKSHNPTPVPPTANCPKTGKKTHDFSFHLRHHLRQRNGCCLSYHQDVCLSCCGKR